MGTTPIERASFRRFGVGLLLAGVVIYMCLQAYAAGVGLAGANGFAADFHGTIWAADRAVLHGHSPYPSTAGSSAVAPAVYLPPIYLATLPLGWLPLHVAAWVWFGCLFTASCGVLAVLGVRDLWCYAFLMFSLPVEEALVLGNASVLLALGVALAWRFRHRPLLCPLIVAATVTVKVWLWPLIVWLLIVRPRSGVRAAIACGALTFGAWAAIGFHGLLGYPTLMRSEAHVFAGAGVLPVAAIMHLDVGLTLATAIGVLGGLALLATAWCKRSSEIEALSLVLLAALVATPVGWPHYLVLSALPLVIVSRTRTLAWAWFPGLWVAEHVGLTLGGLGRSIALSLFAALPVVVVLGSRARATAGLPVFDTQAAMRIEPAVPIG